MSLPELMPVKMEVRRAKADFVNTVRQEVGRLSEYQRSRLAPILALDDEQLADYIATGVLTRCLRQYDIEPDVGLFGQPSLQGDPASSFANAVVDAKRCFCAKLADELDRSLSQREKALLARLLETDTLSHEALRESIERNEIAAHLTQCVAAFGLDFLVRMVSVAAAVSRRFPSSATTGGCDATFIALTLTLSEPRLPVQPSEDGSRLSVQWTLDSRVRQHAGMMLIVLSAVPGASAPDRGLADRTVDGMAREGVEARAAAAGKRRVLDEAVRRQEETESELRVAEDEHAWALVQRGDLDEARTSLRQAVGESALTMAVGGPTPVVQEAAQKLVESRDALPKKLAEIDKVEAKEVEALDRERRNALEPCEQELRREQEEFERLRSIRILYIVRFKAIRRQRLKVKETREKIGRLQNGFTRDRQRIKQRYRDQRAAPEEVVERLKTRLIAECQSLGEESRRRLPSEVCDGIERVASLERELRDSARKLGDTSGRVEMLKRRWQEITAETEEARAGLARAQSYLFWLGAESDGDLKDKNWAL